MRILCSPCRGTGYKPDKKYEKYELCVRCDGGGIPTIPLNDLT